MPIQQPPSLRSSTTPAARAYPQLSNLKLPQPLVQAITQAFQATYATADQANSNAISISQMINYGTWDEMWNIWPGVFPEGALWYVTDRPNISYQTRLDPKSQALQWFFCDGISWPTSLLTPPPPKSLLHAALDLNDTGYMTVGANQFNSVTGLQVWLGTAWRTLLGS
jgi:hypothetical protein